MVEACGNCKFSYKNKEDLICLRYPPIEIVECYYWDAQKEQLDVGNLVTQYPSVDADMWCGEWRLKNNEL